MERLGVPRVAIIYFSAAGTTAALAEALHAGAAELADVVSCRIDPTDIIEDRYGNETMLRAADAADAVVFGSPTYMGGPAAQFKAFADATGERWVERRWAGKLSAGFTTGSCPIGDQGGTLGYFALFAMQHGMLWCGLDIPGGHDPEGRNRLGTQIGLATHARDGILPQADLDTARHLGLRLARLAAPRRG